MTNQQDIMNGIRSGAAVAERSAVGAIRFVRTDVPALLAAVDTVLAACDRIIDNTDGHKPPGPPHPTREQAVACRIRAAVYDALEGK